MEQTMKKIPWNIVAGAIFALLSLYELYWVLKNLISYHYFSIGNTSLHFFIIFAVIAVFSFLSLKNPVSCVGFALLGLEYIYILIVGIIQKWGIYLVYDSNGYEEKVNPLTMLPTLLQLLACLLVVAMIIVIVLNLSNMASLMNKLFFVPGAVFLLAYILGIMLYILISKILHNQWYGYTVYLSLHNTLFGIIVSLGMVTAVAAMAYKQGNMDDIFSKVSNLASSMSSAVGGNSQNQYGGEFGNGGFGMNDEFGQNPNGPYTGNTQNPNPAGPARTMPNTNAPQIAGMGYMSLMTHALLLLFTFGIWMFIYIYKLTDFLNCEMTEGPRSAVAQLLLCLFVPFYGVYWIYKSAQRVDRLAAQKGVQSELSGVCLLLAFFCNTAAFLLMQDKINTIVSMQ